jgi:mono/diheme cytochrome c family protein
MGRMIGLGVGIAAAVVALTVAVRPVQAGVDEGKALYEKKCKVCHSVGGDGGKMAHVGGPLDGVGKKHDAGWLEKYLADPKAAKPDSKMPKVKLTEPELKDVVAFLLTLQSAPPAQ